METSDRDKLITLIEKVGNIQEGQDDFHQRIDAQLEKILQQTMRTNGRVNKLENWRSLLVGGWSIVTFLVIPILTYIYFEHEAETQARFDSLQAHQ